MGSILPWAPRTLTAQAIRGVVIDDQNQAPVVGALVRLVAEGSLGAAVEADTLGFFFLATPGEGEYQLEVQRVGYLATRSQSVFVAQGDTVSVEFRVAPNALLMDPITVTGRSRRGRVAFDRRRSEWGKGVFLSPEALDSIAPRHPADVFRGVERVDLRWDWGQSPSGQSARMPSVRTSLGRGCMLYVVDWVPVVPAPWEKSDWVGYQLSSLQGKDIVAVEVYRSVLEVPPELSRHTHRFRPVISGAGVRYEDIFQCGLTVFWTRSGW